MTKMEIVRNLANHVDYLLNTNLPVSAAEAAVRVNNCARGLNTMAQNLLNEIREDEQAEKKEAVCDEAENKPE